LPPEHKAKKDSWAGKNTISRVSEPDFDACGFAVVVIRWPLPKLFAVPAGAEPPMLPETASRDSVPAEWTHHHLLDLERLTPDEIRLLLDTTDLFKQATDGCRKRLTVLAGTTVVNLFFENSTRTRVSFGLAARRLGADVIDFTTASSSLSKGESFIDTARNLEAMGIDAVVVRHATPGTPHLLAQHLRASVINAGDGPHEHPTQGLLDIFSIRERLGSLEGITVGLVGDIAHSRTARSNLWGLTKLGARVILCGPPTLVSDRWRELGCEVSHDLDAILPRCDVLNLLRIQFERQSTRPFPSVREYAHLYAMTGERLRRARRDLVILAPGPINRGVEVTADVADCPQSLILDQVTNGLAVRMAVLWLLCGPRAAAVAADGGRTGRYV
jgi:aspartate carbamoyltransferase catalytic subunit